jgi:receptor protein-tyrosine kinase
MSIIEKAAQRLEQLRQAGVETPTLAADPAADAFIANRAAERPAALERHAPARETAHVAEASVSSGAPSGTSGDVAGRGLRSRVVEIDLGTLAAAGYITPEAPRSKIADEFRVLKRPIIKNAQVGSASSVAHANCVMVTSALPGEGKSFVALNLALSIAVEVDTTVLLVDADVANPNLLKRMHLPAAKGLLDLLTNEKETLADVLLRTNVEKLTLLPAGTPHQRATEMLASAAMVDLVQQMSKRYPDRILVFDSPPLLVTTEARVLASHMGQIVMVVEADHTNQGNVTTALETVENCPIVLMVLNKTTHADLGSYGSYGSYGGYGGYGGYGAPAKIAE